MRNFLKYCLLFISPMLVMVVCYVVFDPFKLIKHYDSYYDLTDVITLNRGYVSTMHYINNKDTYNYDSFIFGNSRSIAYHEEEWQKYIPEGSLCYHFDESGGSVGGIYFKIRYINKYAHIKNALLVVDPYLLTTTVQTGHLGSIPPVLNYYQNIINFHVESFLAFYNISFIHAFIDYKLTSTYKSYMGWLIKDPSKNCSYNSVNNELLDNLREEKVLNGTYYDEEHISVFNEKQFPNRIANVAINEERMDMLKSIKLIFDEQHTNYKIVISPLYDQVKLNPIDFNVLCDIFGKENVFDFSGKNKWTDDYHNYYEDSHYRPCVANEIMRIIYRENKCE